MINITNIVKEFRPKDMQTYISNFVNTELVYRNYFPTKFTPYLTWEALEAEFGATVAADIVAINSRAPLKGRENPNKITGDIPKILIAREKNERTIQVYRQLKQKLSEGSQSGQAANALVDWMYEDSIFAVNGIHGRMELMAKEAASTGFVTLTLANNGGNTVTPVPVGFGVPNANIANSNTNWWANAATAKPISDIKLIQAAARAKGYTYKYITMDGLTFDQMVLSDEVIKFTAGSLATLLAASVPDVTLDSLNTRLRANRLPEIRIWDSSVKTEDKDGTRTTRTGWKLGNVVFSIEADFGTTQYTETADETIDPKLEAADRAFSDYVMIKAYADLNPPVITTMGIAMAVPVLKNVKQHYIAVTKQS